MKVPKIFDASARTMAVILIVIEFLVALALVVFFGIWMLATKEGMR